ncbi:type II secretion system protein GspM [Halioglobus maricola]|nr:type II secretion system protein GspM [Halioglobus maricola]
MIAWAKMHRRSATICGLTLLVPLLVYLSLVVDAWGLRASYQEDIERLQPRIARMQGIQAFEKELGASAGTVRRQVADLVYPPSIDAASAGTSLQKEVRQLMGSAGLAVSNSQLLPVREEEKFDRVSLKLTVAGELPALDRALASLNDFSPRVTVATFDVWPTRQRRSKGAEPTQQVTATIELVALRSLL